MGNEYCLFFMVFLFVKEVSPNSALFLLELYLHRVVKHLYSLCAITTFMTPMILVRRLLESICDFLVKLTGFLGVAGVEDKHFAVCLHVDERRFRSV